MARHQSRKRGQDMAIPPALDAGGSYCSDKPLSRGHDRGDDPSAELFQIRRVRIVPQVHDPICRAVPVPGRLPICVEAFIATHSELQFASIAHAL
jgi:hypothetical protein